MSAAIALGSAFFHASHTSLGQRTDGDIISVIALIMHQAALSGLPEDLKTPQLMDLGAGRRSRTGVQIAQVTHHGSKKPGHLATLGCPPYPYDCPSPQDVTDMYSWQPYSQWMTTLDSIDLPGYEVSTLLDH